MKKIGFIDYYIDEWHANNYPKMIRESQFKDQFDVGLAWEQMTPAGKKTLDVWCKEKGVPKADSLEQVVKECDCLLVLSPDNPEKHEELADLALKSGKPVCIDKPFAPTLAAAKRLFDKAAAHKTPLMSSSALRFAPAVEKALQEEVKGTPVQFVSTRGGGHFDVYAIHQLEMLVMALGTGATRVMQCGNKAGTVMVIDYADGRRGTIQLINKHPFQFSAAYGEGQLVSVSPVADFFPRFIDGMLTFFAAGKSIIPPEQTREIAALTEAGCLALKKLDQWVPVPR